MPSSLIVRCVPIKNVRTHPNADNLVIIDIMGWQVCTHKDTKPEVDELRVFIPPDAVLPQELAEQLEVTKYLRKGNRVGQKQFRGEMSFGIAATNTWGFAKGEEVSEKLGITKYIPPITPHSGDQERDHPYFLNYPHIENWRNYPEVFTQDDFVFMHEKVHGTNSKVGIVPEDEEGDNFGLDIFVIGSHNTRKKFVDPEDENYRKKVSLYQYPLNIVSPLLMAVQEAKEARVVIIYGEIFGRVQDLKYGRNNELAYRAFDIYVDGKFLDWEEVEKWCVEYKVDTPPLVYAGPFSEAAMKSSANQNTLLMPPDTAHMSEGVIIRPQKESKHPEIGRKILKFKSDAYEERFARGKGTEFA